MKNSIILLSFLFISTLFAETTNTFSKLFAQTKNSCNFYNSQYDKYQELASEAPDASLEKVHYIRKMDFYDEKIYEDNSCNFTRVKDSDNIIDAIISI